TWKCAGVRPRRPAFRSFTVPPSALDGRPPARSLPDLGQEAKPSRLALLDEGRARVGPERSAAKSRGESRVAGGTLDTSGGAHRADLLSQAALALERAPVLFELEVGVQLRVVCFHGCRPRQSSGMVV